MKKTARKKDVHQAAIAAQRFLPMVGGWYRLRDRLLPLIRMAELLERPKPFTAETVAAHLRAVTAAGSR